MTMYAEPHFCAECEEFPVYAADAICPVCLDKKRTRPAPPPDDGPATPSDRLPAKVIDLINRAINPRSNP